MSSNAGGADTFNGGGNTDTADYSAVTSAVTADLSDLVGSNVSGTGAGADTLSGVENVTGGSAGDSITGDGNANVLTGGGGFDTLKGGGNGDTLVGGETLESYTAATGEGDRATYAGELTAADITTSGGGWQVAVGGAEGTDLLSGIEIIVDGSGDRFLLVGNGGFASIAEAYAEAVDGDTIILAAGAYDEDLAIAKAINIVGAQLGVPERATWGRNPPSPANGRSTRRAARSRSTACASSTTRARAATASRR